MMQTRFHKRINGVVGVMLANTWPDVWHRGQCGGAADLIHCRRWRRTDEAGT